jgi:2-methylisocitrate lyase-like PEP mutase family enzyme
VAAIASTGTEGGREEAPAQFRRQLRDGFPVAPGVYDTLSARIAESAGFQTLHLSGFAVASTQLGLPDIGLIGMAEMAAAATRVSAASRQPLICDIDTGFGGVNAVARTITTFERLGAAAVHIEDQADPKRCPALDGRVPAPVEEFSMRLEAALEARHDPDFSIIARSDGDELSFADLVDRCNHYLEIGADLVMPMLFKADGVRVSSLSTAEQIELHERLLAEIAGPVVGLSIPPGVKPEEMRQLGYAALILPLVSLRAAANAISTALRAARDDGTAAEYLASQTGDLQTHEELMDLQGLKAYQARDRRLN